MLKRIILNFLLFLIPSGHHGDRLRGRAYQIFMKKCGKNFKVSTNAFIYAPEKLSVGDNVYIGFNSYLGQGEINLSDEVLIGNFVSITASNHLKKNGSWRFGGFKPDPINIGRGAWLSANSCITAGVNIGSGTVVGAGAVVTKSFGSDKILIGIPAQEKI